MQFRDYQLEAIYAWWDYMRHRSGHPLIKMPTGTGKSLVLAGLIHSIMTAYPSTRVLALTHVKTLIEQNHAKLLQLWPTAPAGINSAGVGRRDTDCAIIYASIQSVYKTPEAFGWLDLVFVDEAHLVNPEAETMYLAFFEALRKINKHVRITGLTATDYRLGLGRLTDGGIFTDVCCDQTTVEWFNRFIAAGHMAALRARPTAYELDTSGVKLSGGEFVGKQLEAALDHDHITRAALEELCRTAYASNRRRWLLFATGISHAEHIGDVLTQWGVSNVVIHSRLRAAVNAERYAAFRDGHVTAAVNMSQLTTGVDVPEIDLIGMLRPTMSASLWVQMLGRGTRPAPWAGKRDCLVLDFAGNARRLGPINDPVVPRSKRERKQGLAQRGAPIKVCGNKDCGDYVHASVRQCPACGYTFFAAVRIGAQSDGEAEVMRTEEPQVELFDVERITYRKHGPFAHSKKPPTLCVSYYSGLRMVQEYICFEHAGWPRSKAQSWWRERYMRAPGEPADTPPETVDAALPRLGSLAVPTRIRVWTNKKPKPEVMGYVFERATQSA